VRVPGSFTVIRRLTQTPQPAASRGIKRGSSGNALLLESVLLQGDPMITRAVLAFSLLFGSSISGYATTAKSDPSSAEIDKIIRTFASNEAAFAKARENYTYRQTARIQEYDEGNTPHGKFERVDEIVFSSDGKRQERAVRAPVPTLRLIQMSAEDEEDLRHVMPFVLTSAEIDNYHVRYLGRQMADEIPTYVFAVKPKQMVPGKR
jgi:hypothetical protein